MSFCKTLIKMFDNGYLMTTVAAPNETLAWRYFERLARIGRVPFYPFEFETPGQPVLTAPA